MELDRLINFIEFIADIKDRIMQIKNKYDQKISLISNRIGFQIYDTKNKSKYLNMIHTDSLGNIYYSNAQKVIYESAEKYIFIAFDTVNKTFTIFDGKEIKQSYIVDDQACSIIEKIMQNRDKKTILINSFYFASAFEFLIKNIQFIKNNIKALLHLYNNFRQDITGYLTQAKIILNCFIKIKHNKEPKQLNSLNTDYRMLFHHSIFYVIYPSVDIETRCKLNMDIDRLPKEIKHLFELYNLQTFTEIVGYDIKLAKPSELTTMSIFAYSIYFNDFFDILLFSEFIKNMKSL